MSQLSGVSAACVCGGGGTACGDPRVSTLRCVPRRVTVGEAAGAVCRLINTRAAAAPFGEVLRHRLVPRTDLNTATVACPPSLLHPSDSVPVCLRLSPCVPSSDGTTPRHTVAQFTLTPAADRRQSDARGGDIFLQTRRQMCCSVHNTHRPGTTGTRYLCRRQGSLVSDL